MEFTEPYKHTNPHLCKFSPNSNYLALTLNNNLIVRDSESLDNVIVFNCESKIDYFEFDQDSNLILCLIKNLRIIQFWSLSNLEWTGKLTNTLFEISEAGWVPNNKFFWSFAEPSLRLTIFSISSDEIGYIQNVKFGKKGMSYREDNLFVAILERKDGKDYIGIYNTENWDMKRNFVLESIDAQGLLWSPNGQFIAVWESYVENKLWIYSPIGELITTYQSQQVGLGIKVINWSPMSKYLILSHHNQSIELLNTFSWKPSIIFNHFQHFRNTDIDLYEELDNPTWKHLLDPGLIGDGGSLLPPPKEKNKEARYTIAKLPFSIPTIPLDYDKPDPPIGASICSFNSDGTLVVSRNDNMPNNLWIWSVQSQKLIAFSNQLLPIKQAIWNPVDPNQLTFVCGNKHIYLWTLEIGFECFEIPFNEFIIKNIDWSPDGSSIVLSSRDTFCLGFPILEVNNNAGEDGAADGGDGDKS